MDRASIEALLGDMRRRWGVPIDDDAREIYTRLLADVDPRACRESLAEFIRDPHADLPSPDALRARAIAFTRPERPPAPTPMVASTSAPPRGRRSAVSVLLWLLVGGILGSVIIGTLISFIWTDSMEEPPESYGVLSGAFGFVGGMLLMVAVLAVVDRRRRPAMEAQPPPAPPPAQALVPPPPPAAADEQVAETLMVPVIRRVIIGEAPLLSDGEMASQPAIVRHRGAYRAATRSAEALSWHLTDADSPVNGEVVLTWQQEHEVADRCLEAMLVELLVIRPGEFHPVLLKVAQTEAGRAETNAPARLLEWFTQGDVPRATRHIALTRWIVAPLTLTVDTNPREHAVAEPQMRLGSDLTREVVRPLGADAEAWLAGIFKARRDSMIEAIDERVT